MYTMDRDAPEDAFSLVASEVRLGIIRAIGDASGGGEYAVLSHGDLLDALDISDSGNLNYHLRKLRGRFVERVEDGYQLTIPGIRVYQAVLSGGFTVDHYDVPPTPTENECVECSSKLQVRYENARYYLECHECGWVHTRYPLPPNAFDPDDPESLWLAGQREANSSLRTFLEGICPYCSGPVRTDVTTDEALVATADERVFGRLECTSCHWYHHHPIATSTLRYPVTQVFYDERGIRTDPYIRRRFRGSRPIARPVVRRGPPRVRG